MTDREFGYRGGRRPLSHDRWETDVASLARPARKVFTNNQAGLLAPRSGVSVVA